MLHTPPGGSPTDTCTVLYVTRNTWKPYAPPIPYITAPGTIPEPIHNFTTYVSNYLNSFRYVRLPTSSTFAEDAEAGLHSSNFNLAENIEAGDSRRGLDENAKQEVYRIMKVRRVGFDEARRMFMEERFGREGIAADGRPLDRKAVMFS
jgi:hypothetical protein